MEDPWEYYERVNPGYGKKRFSSIEIRDILIALLIISVAFTVILVRAGNVIYADRMMNILILFGLSALLVSTGFLLHEFAHKFVAQRYGAWAEFRMYPAGLMMALMFSFFGFLFAAPGAVYINGRIDDRMNGKISVAGPLVNIIIGGIAMTVAYTVTDDLIGWIAYWFAFFNMFLAFFNLLPIPPMDGSKILKWNPAIYVTMIAIAFVAMLSLWGFI